MGRGITGLIVASALCSFATIARADGALGAEAGLNVAYGSTGAGANGGPRIGLLVGGTFELPVNSRFALRTGLRYSQKGARAELFNLLRVSVGGTLKLDAIDVPVQAVLRYPLKRVTPFAVVGPVASFIVSKSFEMQTFTFIQSNMDQRFRSFDLALETTVGAEFSLSRDVTLSVWGRFDYGFLDLDSTNATFASRAFATGLGTAYRF